MKGLYNTYNRGAGVPGAQLRGQPFILGKTMIPFIGLSSGSVAANGAISGITALAVTYASAYCYFPANILATVKAAGFYYCTFSSGSAGTAFLDTPTWPPTIPASPTAVTDGKGAFTGDTGEEFLPAIPVPANAMGANGQIRGTWELSANNNANAKTFRTRFSTSAGAILLQTSVASGTNTNSTGVFGNIGVTNVQKAVTAAGGFVPGAADTTAATTIVASIQRATATDNLTVEMLLYELLSDGT